MTNTLHRRGSAEELRRDFVVFCLPSRSLSPELPDKLRAFTRIVLKHKPINANRLEGRAVVAVDPDNIEQDIGDGFCLHATYDNVDAVAAVVKELTDADLGLPINISGPLDEAQRCCREAGITRHSVEQSLGVKGAADRLPAKEILELNSLCGHGLVGYNLIERVQDYIKTGRMTPAEGARFLARPCQCGVYNLTRAAEILARSRVSG